MHAIQSEVQISKLWVITSCQHSPYDELSPSLSSSVSFMGGNACTPTVAAGSGRDMAAGWTGWCGQSAMVFSC